MNAFFMHHKQDLVNDAIAGLLQSAPWHNLARLDAGDGIRVVVRRDWDRQRVALISGGGSGHEPAHAGLVGKGMLTAAVCGDIFASPSVEAVLTAIINVTGDAGCLLIVKNYTGDRLNFGLAAERARQMGYAVAMVMVKDDIALVDNPQPRGLAGTALVHKIAGAAAEQGADLAAVTAAAQGAADALASIGVAFSSCHLPGEARETRVPAGSCEVGMGIHGEPGAQTLPSQDSREIVQRLSQALAAARPEARQALLINNLGGFSQLEMALLTREVLRGPLGDRIAGVIGPVTLVSALDMKGFSLSLLALDAAREAALAAPVEVTCWAPLVAPQPPRWQAAILPERQAAPPSENASRARLLTIVADTLLQAEAALNALDAKVGDGDTGSTFAAGAQAIRDALAQRELPLDQPAALFSALGEKLATVMGGSSGVLLSIGCSVTGQQLAAGLPLPQALQAGLAQMQYYGGAAPGDRTLIDALDPALRALAAGQSLSAAAAAAEAGAVATAQMTRAGAGRSAYLNAAHLAGVVDPGASAVARVFSALAQG
ncbi:dihydroxyacetone kinase subunit DhaK [Pantoea sp. 1.19]|uniref:dihydroxyacetone kinase subunit DhaK n=1 Tax=Pantoea sp. 1.19 TaxID=1925589 RepID=UPI000948BA48|nr:dihydroxyacetone kinase subunit DhaK [Pantoea sp. 1.19]